MNVRKLKAKRAKQCARGMDAWVRVSDDVAQYIFADQPNMIIGCKIFSGFLNAPLVMTRRHLNEAIYRAKLLDGCYRRQKEIERLIEQRMNREGEKNGQE